MIKRLKSIITFIAAHPLLTIGIILTVDGLVVNMLRIDRKSKSENVIDAEFEIKGEENG